MFLCDDGFAKCNTGLGHFRHPELNPSSCTFYMHLGILTEPFLDLQEYFIGAMKLSAGINWSLLEAENLALIAPK